MMEDKKQPCRFTIQFNSADPQQQRAIDLLNAQGRRKATFITNALLYYISEGHQKPLPDAEQAVDTLLIEEVVNRILAKRDALSKEPATAKEPTPVRVPPKPQATVISQDDIGLDIPEDLFASIASAVDGFRL